MSAPPELLARLDAALRELARVRFEVPEDEPGAARGALFAPRLARRLEEGLALVEEARARYERVTSAPEPMAGGDPGAGEAAGQELLHALDLARARLAAARQDLAAAVAQREPVRVASACDAGLRTLRRALASTEAAIHDLEGVPQPERPWPDLETALRTRALYAGLRREILGNPAPRDPELADRLAGAHDRLARLRELELWPLLRFDDRVVMRELRRRLARWVTSEAQDVAEGRGLWGDLRALAKRLAAVSDRAELRRHDRTLLRRTWHGLFGRAKQAGGVAPEQLQRLELLRGLDEELDRLLEAHEGGDLRRWEAVLSRLLERLSSPLETVAAGAPANGE